MLSEAEKVQEFGNLTEKGLNQWIQSIVSAVNDHNYDGNVREKYDLKKLCSHFRLKAGIMIGHLAR